MEVSQCGDKATCTSNQQIKPVIIKATSKTWKRLILIKPFYYWTSLKHPWPCFCKLIKASSTTARKELSSTISSSSLLQFYIYSSVYIYCLILYLKPNLERERPSLHCICLTPGKVEHLPTAKATELASVQIK